MILKLSMPVVILWKNKSCRGIKQSNDGVNRLEKKTNRKF